MSKDDRRRDEKERLWNEVLNKGFQDYRIVSNVETRIMDVFQH